MLSLAKINLGQFNNQWLWNCFRSIGIVNHTILTYFKGPLHFNGLCQSNPIGKKNTESEVIFCKKKKRGKEKKSRLFLNGELLPIAKLSQAPAGWLSLIFSLSSYPPHILCNHLPHIRPQPGKFIAKLNQAPAVWLSLIFS